VASRFGLFGRRDCGKGSTPPQTANGAGLLELLGLVILMASPILGIPATQGFFLLYFSGDLTEFFFFFFWKGLFFFFFFH
jgi:hypothetical protein